MWYNIFSTTLEVIGFEINPFDRCVANKMIEGKYCTISWYMDDKKLPHKKPTVISYIIKKAEKSFGDLFIVIRNKHTLVWMIIDIKENEIQVDMVE